MIKEFSETRSVQVTVYKEVCDECEGKVDELFRYVIASPDHDKANALFCSTNCFRKHIVKWAGAIVHEQASPREMFQTLSE